MIMNNLTAVGLSTIFLLAAVLVFIPSQAEAARINVTIIMNDSYVYVDQGGGNMTASGIVDVDISNLGENIEDVVVELKADAGGWDWYIYPEELVFVASYEPQPFTVYIEVPKGHEVLYERDVFIFGNVTTYPLPTNYDLREDNYTIVIQPRIDYTVFKDVDAVNMGLNDEVIIDFEIYNNGDVEDTVSPSLLQTETTLLSNGFLYSFDKVSFMIEPGGRRAVTLTLTSPESKTLVQDEEILIHIGVRSQRAQKMQNDDEWYDELKITINTQHQSPDDDIDPDDDTGGSDAPAVGLIGWVFLVFSLFPGRPFLRARRR
jgi:hypothetical protein